MSDQEHIESKVISAMKIACDETFYFSEDETRPIDAEYLLTVNVAKQIAILNRGIGYPYKIYLEHPTKKFASYCVPLMGKNSVTNRMAMGKRQNTKRNGKIDVAVYRDGTWHGKPVCAIELKGFNPQRKVVIEDLKRNAEYFDLSCDSGSSQIAFTVFAALHSYKYVQNEESVTKNQNFLRTKYSKWLSELNSSNSYSANINIFTLSKCLSDDQEIPPGEEYIDFESHQFVGVMVTFTVTQ